MSFQTATQQKLIYLICLTIVDFPDSPAPIMQKKSIKASKQKEI